ncbi:tail fiber domain-containing protein [Robinsoniella peoriensis]|uniref:tail fiber domain-containing protein n=1 Tax=Robinsoniella peoriensis TaxID=180332 RepID=UPI0005C7C77F|nr:tail fiber domain-containing protein [Robinsoniella peoriensis]
MKASNQLTILNIEEQTFEDICTHDTTTGLIECTHAPDQGCVRVTELQGKSEQAQSTLGKNLLDLTHAIIIVQGTGFTYTIQNSNAVTLNCTNPGAYSSLHINLVGLTTGKSYSVSGVQSGKNITLGMDEATDAAFVNRTVINGSQVTVREGYFYKLKIYANINSTSSTETYTNTYTNIQLEEGSTATAYEPFIPNSPSPDYPSVINSVGDSGKLNMVSSNGRRNLFEQSEQFMLTPTWTGAKGTVEEVNEPTSPYGKAIKITITTAGRGFYCYSGFMPIKKMEVGRKYTWGLLVKSNRVLTSEIFGHECGGTKNYTISSEWEKYSFTYTMNNSPYRAFLMYFNFTVGDVIYIHSFKLVEGENIDNWSPAPEDITPENYKQYEDKLSLASANLTSPLRSLPNGVHDVLECKDGIWGVTRNCGLLHIDGTANFTTHNSLVSSKEIRVSHPGNRNNNLICSNFKNVLTTWDIDKVGIFAASGLNLESIAFRIPINSDPKVFFRDNPTDVVYELKTPTWEPLDTSSQIALNNLLSYSGKDYIYTTDPLATNFSMAVKSRAFYENFKIQEEIKNTNSSLGDLDDEIKGGFYDGIINVNEAEAIRKAAETMHTQVTNQFNKVDSNPSLTGTPKTTHQTKYTECNNAYNTLISKINTAIDYCSVNSTKTDSQKKTAVTDMNTAFGTYKTKLADYQKAYQDAIDAIAKKKADDAVDDVVIGGRNIFRQSGHWEKLPDTKYWGNNGGTINLDTTVKYLGYNTLRTTVGNGIYGYSSEWIELDTNKIYTYSSMILTNANVTGGPSTPLHCQSSVDKVNIIAGVEIIKFQQSAIANKWTLLYLTFKPKVKYWRPFVYLGSGSTIFNIAYLKLEEGTKPTDWTPNIEDTDEKITEVSATLTSTISDVKFIVDEDHKNITNKVWKSDILTGIKDLNVGGINLWDLSAIKRYASGSLNTIVAGTTVDAKTGKITVTSDPQSVPGCKIDVSTLTRNTSNIGELIITGYFDRPDSDENKLKNVNIHYRCFNNANAEIQPHTSKLIPVEASSNLFAGTLSIPANTAYINFGVGQFPYVKPYTLTGITVKDSALYDITKGLRDQVSQAYQDISGFKQTVSDTYTTKTEFDQLSVSGRNLLRNTSYEDNIEGTLNRGTYHTISRDTVNKYNGNNSLKIVCNTVSISGAQDVWQYLWKEMILDKPVTASFYIKGSIATTGWMRVATAAVSASAQTFSITTSWKKIEIDFGKVILESDSSHIAELIYGFNATGTFYINSMMLEYSTKPSDWTPAPEDTDEKFTNYTTTTDMNSLINQTKSDIELGVSKAYTSKAEGDKITQGLNKWILEVYQLTSSSMPNPRVADIENIRGKVPTKIIEVADTAMSASLNTGDYYIGHAFTYLYFDAAYTWSGTIKTDDEGVVYLNGVKKVSTTTSVATNISLPFQAGWNVLEVVYNEGTSNDGWLFSSKLSTLSQCKIMNCYAQVSLNASALIKVTADAISHKVENDAAYAEFTEQAGKMAWLVKSGTEAANMELTPEALNVIADKINLTGKVTFSSLATDAKKKIEEAKQAGTDAQESLNNLTLSGRNLLKNTSYENNIEGTNNRGTYHTISRDTANKYNGNNSLKIVCNTVSVSGAQDVWQYLWKEMIMDKPVTVSFYIKGSVATTGWIRMSGATTTARMKSFYITTNWAKVTIDFGVVDNECDIYHMAQIIYGFNSVGTYYMNSLMLEYATKPSDWSAAPEDINASIAILGEDLQDQIDGKIESYNQTTNPADAWTTADIKTQHTGDIWYDDTAKLTQRWSGTAWMPLKDADAIAAQNLAQQKKRVFTATPTTPYDVGDLWVQGGTGDIMKCKTALASGSYNAAHWEKASKYTDDTTANQAVSNTILTPADKISLYATFLNIQNEYSRLKDQCTNLGVADTLKTSYDALYALLNGIVGTTTLQNSTTTGFNKSNYDTLYKNYVTAREALEQAQISKVYEYTNTIKEHFTTEKALAVANWFASQDKTMIDGAYIYTGTVTAKQIAANSIDTDHLAVGMNPNLVRYGLDTMEQFSTVPYFSKSATATVTLDDSQYYIGTKSIKFIGTSDSNSVCLGSKETDYGCVPVTSGKMYILSCYVKTTSTSYVNAFIGFVAHPNISASNIVNYGNASKTIKNTDGWVRLSIKYTASSAYPYVSIRINVESPSFPVWFDAFQIEEVDSEDKEPGTFKQAGTTTIDGGNITTGIMKSANYNYSSGNFTVAGTMIDLATGVIRSKGFGMDASGNSYFNGTVTATTLTASNNGIIAGWNINSTCLWKGNSTIGQSGSSNIYLGNSGVSFSDKFIYKTSTGVLEVNGKILASSGQIGGANGFNIKTGAIWRGSETWGAAGNGNIYLGVDGFSLSDKLKYKDGVLEVNGVVNATSGKIGVWNLDTELNNGHWGDGKGTGLGQSYTDSNYASRMAFWAGDGKFKVTYDGAMTATSGIIGGWNITTGSMNRQFTANNKNYWLYFDTGTTTDNYAAFMLRTKATTASAWEDKFSIAWNGKMTAMDADVRGVINATSLQAKDTIQMYSALTVAPETILQLVKPTVSSTYDVLLMGDGLNTSSYLQFQRHAIFTNGAIINAGGLVVNNNISASEIYASQHHISSYDGGWFMQDSTWVRSIGNKSIYTGSQIMAGNAIYEFGTLLSNRYQAKGSYSASSHTHGNIVNGIYSWNISGTGNLIPRKNGTDTAANIGANSTTGCVDAVYYKSLVNKSDRRFKENIRDISLAEALTIVENLNIKSYNYKDDKAKIKNYGILGQELRDLLIESSHELFSGLSIDDRYEEGRPVYDLEANEEYVIYGVNYTQFIPLLIKAMQYVLKEIHKDKKL